MIWLFVFTPVAAWFAAQEFSFLATRSICATGHKWILYLVMGSALAATAGAGAGSWTRWKALAHGVQHRRFLALGGVLLAMICGVSILALLIAASIHRPCD